MIDEQAAAAAPALDELCWTIDRLMPGAVERHQLRTKDAGYVEDFLTGLKEALAEAEAMKPRDRRPHDQMVERQRNAWKTSR